MSLDLPDTVIPKVNIDSLRLTSEQRQQREPRVVRPHETRRHYPALSPYAKLFDDEAPIMSLDDVRHKPNPNFVPFAMGKKIGDDDVRWRPPSPKKPPKIDVSTAEVLEKPVLPPPEPMYDAPKTKLVAYDDSDPFPSRVRRLPNTSEVEDSGVRITTAKIHLQRNHIAVFNYDNSMLWLVDTFDLSKGWKKYPCLGQAPSPEVVVLSNADDATFVAVEGSEYFILEVVPGEPELRWVRCLIGGNWDKFTVLWAHVIDADSFYIRSQTQHALVTPDFRVEHETRHKQVHTVASKIISPHETLCTAERLRSTPVAEELEAVAKQNGVAMHLCSDHIWVYVFIRAARNFLPVKRVDVVHPLFATLPRGLYLFSPPAGVYRSNVYQVSWRISAPTVKPGSAMPEVEVEDARKDGEVTLRLQKKDVAVMSPMNDNCVAVLARDLETYVVVEVDRIEKVRNYIKLPRSYDEDEEKVDHPDLTQLLL